MGERVSVELSRAAATFLRGMVEHMNQLKILPENAWLEEIEAQTRRALLEAQDD